MQTPDGAAFDDSGGRRASRRLARAATAADLEALRRRVYGKADLSSFSRRDRFIIRAAGLFFFILIRVICVTCRWEAHGAEHLEAIHHSGRRAIFTFWHVCIFAATWFWRGRGIIVMSSTSRDAEYTSRFIQRFGYGAARGSSTPGSEREMAHLSE